MSDILIILLKSLVNFSIVFLEKSLNLKNPLIKNCPKQQENVVFKTI